MLTASGSGRRQGCARESRFATSRDKAVRSAARSPSVPAQEAVPPLEAVVVVAAAAPHVVAEAAAAAAVVALHPLPLVAATQAVVAEVVASHPSQPAAVVSIPSQAATAARVEAAVARRFSLQLAVWAWTPPVAYPPAARRLARLLSVR